MGSQSWLVRLRWMLSEEPCYLVVDGTKTFLDLLQQ